MGGFYALIAMVAKNFHVLAGYSVSWRSVCFRKDSDSPGAVLGLYEGLEIV